MNSAVLATSYVEAAWAQPLDDFVSDVEDDDQSASLSNLTSEDFLSLNIGGQNFKMTNSTLSRLPESSLLHQLALGIIDEQFYSRFPYVHSKAFCILPDTREYYFDRSPDMFQYILSYCVNNRLHCPDPTHARQLKRELMFWGLKNVNIEKCCRPVNNDLDDRLAIVEKLRPVESIISKTAKVRRRLSARRKADPDSSCCCKFTLPCCVKVFTGLSVFFLTLSILNLVLSTEPSFQSANCWFQPAPPRRREISGLSPNILDQLRQLFVDASLDNGLWFFNTSDSWFDSISATVQDGSKTNGHPESSTAPPESSDCPDRPRKNLQTSCINPAFIFDIIESVCMAWFTVEYLMRFFVNRRLAFLKDFLNIIDMLSTLPFYVEIVLDSVQFGCYQYESIDSLLAALKVLRVFRIFKMARYFRALRVFGATLAGSKSELASITIFTSVTIVIFSSIIYYVERDDPDTLYVSISTSFWWCIVTITTTGYGDIYPRTVGGKIIGAVACVAGILILAFPVSILTEHFMITYKREIPPPVSKADTDDDLDSILDDSDYKVPVAQYLNCGSSERSSDTPNSICRLEILDEQNQIPNHVQGN